MSATMPGTGYDPRRGRWIPWAFVGGFLVVFGVNGLLIYFAITTFTGDQGRLVGRTFGQGYTAEGVLEGVPTTFNLGGIAVVNYADGSRYEGQFRSVGMQGQIVKQGLGALYNSSGALVQAGRFENDAYAGPG